VWTRSGPKLSLMGPNTSTRPAFANMVQYAIHFADTRKRERVLHRWRDTMKKC